MKNRVIIKKQKNEKQCNNKKEKNKIQGNNKKERMKNKIII